MSEWRPIPGFEGLYEISSNKEVRSVGRTTVRKIRGNEVQMTVQSKVITPTFTRPNSPPRYTLHSSKGYTCRSVNSLMASAFPELPEYQVGHSSVEDLPGEIWKHVSGWPDCYMVSNKGRFQCLSHIVVAKNRNKDEYDKLVMGGLVVPHHVGDGSQLYVSVRCNGKSFSERLAMIVAREFLPKYNPNLIKVDFADGNRDNCCVDNLIWS